MDEGSGCLGCLMGILELIYELGWWVLGAILLIAAGVGVYAIVVGIAQMIRALTGG